MGPKVFLSNTGNFQLTVPINETLTGTITFQMSGPGSNGKEGILCSSQTSRIRKSSQDAI